MAKAGTWIDMLCSEVMFHLLKLRMSSTIINKDNEQYFKEWINDNIGSSVWSKARPKFTNSATLITNNDAVSNIYKVISENFTRLFRSKMYLYPYLAEGMDEMEFTEAESNVNDLISEYYGWCLWWGDSEFGEQEESENSEDAF